MSTLSAHDARQLQRMLEALDTYDGTLDKLGKLISSLEFLMNALESKEEKALIRSHWGVLEEVYAFALANESERLGDQGAKLASSNVESVRHQIQGKLKLQA